MTNSVYYDDDISLQVASTSGSGSTLVVYFILPNIAAAQLHDVLTITLVGEKADGKTYCSATETYKVTDWLYDRLDKVAAGSTTSQLVQRQLFADMLIYAGAAQSCFTYNAENLADEAMTSTQRGWASSDVAIDGTVPASVTLAGATASKYNFTIDISGAIGMVLTYKVPKGADISNYSLRITWEDKYLGVTAAQTGDTSVPSSAWTFYNTNATNDYYRIKFYDFCAPQLTTVAGLQMYNGETPISNLDYFSIESSAATYAAQQTARGTFMHKMMNYCASADAYFSLVYNLG